MSAMSDLTRYLPRLPLRRLGSAEPAGLWITSLPWPRNAAKQLSLNGRPTFVAPLGRWPRSTHPRRLLLLADADNAAPKQLSLTGSRKNSPDRNRPSATMELFERSPHAQYVWERHLLRIRYGNRSIGLAMGLRTVGEVHWWEACRLVVLQETEECLVV